MIRKLLDKTFWKFILVGVINTVFGTGIMFLFYNVFHLGYWISSASNYIFGSVLSYFLNKHFTFRNKNRSPKVIVRFVVNISVCYLVAYGLAKPAARMLLSGMGAAIQDNGAMLMGMCVFVGLNYLGQRFFAFRETEDENNG